MTMSMSDCFLKKHIFSVSLFFSRYFGIQKLKLLTCVSFSIYFMDCKRWSYLRTIFFVCNKCQSSYSRQCWSLCNICIYLNLFDNFGESAKFLFREAQEWNDYDLRGTSSDYEQCNICINHVGYTCVLTFPKRSVC